MRKLKLVVLSLLVLLAAAGLSSAAFAQAVQVEPRIAVQDFALSLIHISEPTRPY